MSDPSIPNHYGAVPWGRSDPQQGRQPYPEQLGSPAHPQSPYPQSQSESPAPPYPEQYAGQTMGQHARKHAPQHAPQHVPAAGQHPTQPRDAYPPQRRDQPRKPLPEPPAALAVAVVVAACCLLFVELAELAVLLVSANRGDAGGGTRAGFDPNGVTVTGLFLFAAYLAACSWLQASRRFAEAANPAARFAHGVGWTWLGWWVPVVFLWFPYQGVRDVRNAVLPDGERRTGLGWWWACWLLFGLRAYSPASVDLEVLLRSVAAIALLLAFVQWVRIVHETTRAQEKLAGLG
jgi:hypothetical protein